ncbi:PREDICTED: kelch-like protein 24 [Branchiostoma belcheri]|uniref:Kelch-like protein 24 n=1 Tax=Branchiostoma belcheri TaxID=7741 RepID=A0A6P4Z1X5_BRABE|nr:PREDICTED: kelch-like protein 24 [Branchiostoma belcheri]
MGKDCCSNSPAVSCCHAGWFFHSLQNMRSEGMLVDVTLCAKGKEIPCHRLVLAANSEYFKLMFNGSHSESRKDKIEIGGVSAETLQQLVDYAYTSEVNITEENVRSLFEAADMLQDFGVKGHCAEFLQQRVNKETCCGIWALADRMLSIRLAETAKGCALKWFEEACATEEFLQLPFHLLKAYVSDKGLLAKKEERVLEVIMLWVRHDLKEREGHLKELLKCICFSSIDKDYLKDMLKRDKVLARVRGIKQMAKSRPTSESTREISQQEILVLGGSRLYYGDIPEMGPRLHLNSRVYRLGLDSQCIDSGLLPMPFRGNRGIAACVVDGDVIVTGGHESLTQAWRYRPALKSWTKLGSLKAGRFNHGMAVLQGQVYVVGGSRPASYPDVIERLSDVEVYNKRTNRWKKVAPLKLAVSSFGITTYGGKIYIFGGEPYVYDGNDFRENQTQAFQGYDPSQNKWTLHQLPMKMSCIQACTVNSKIYIVGGSLKHVLCVDLEEEIAKPMAETLFPWEQCSAFVCGAEIYISGGRVHQMITTRNGTVRQMETYGSVQCYNVNSDTMVLCKDLPEPLYGHRTVTIAKT